ncbi:MAG TPA: helix-turn-helix transcriptional regulator [Solirubrobacterales bacterium]|jgi:transcriptional regulator with XRE-family HTH domain|nr:helix-turn-helix transcriptional regulator [Solirubrobacterales bacterium]
MDKRNLDAYAYFAEQVARLQRERGLSTGDLAERSGIDRTDLESILSGEGEVAADTILLLSTALEVEPGELLDGIAWVRDDRGGGEYRLKGPGA